MLFQQSLRPWKCMNMAVLELNTAILQRIRLKLVLTDHCYCMAGAEMAAAGIRLAVTKSPQDAHELLPGVYKTRVRTMRVNTIQHHVVPPCRMHQQAAHSFRPDGR